MQLVDAWERPGRVLGQRPLAPAGLKDSAPKHSSEAQSSSLRLHF